MSGPQSVRYVVFSIALGYRFGPGSSKTHIVAQELEKRAKAIEVSVLASPS